MFRFMMCNLWGGLSQQETSPPGPQPGPDQRSMTDGRFLVIDALVSALLSSHARLMACVKKETAPQTLFALTRELFLQFALQHSTSAARARKDLGSSETIITGRASATNDQDIITTDEPASRTLTAAAAAAAVAHEVLTNTLRANNMRRLTLHIVRHVTRRDPAVLRLS